jgi:hypothetical protein
VSGRVRKISPPPGFDPPNVQHLTHMPFGISLLSVFCRNRCDFNFADKMVHCHYGPDDGDINDVCSGIPVVLMKNVINIAQGITDCNDMLTDTDIMS